MKISCPSCSAKYSIADDKVQNRLAKIRCRKCGTSIVIDGTQSPPSVYAATDAAETAPVPPVQGSTGTLFSVDFGEGDQRQLTVSQLVDAYNAGQVNAETYLWAEGYADWTPLGQVDEVVSAIHKAASIVDSNTAAAMSTAPFEDPFPQPPQRSGADLFSGISTAGSERDFATSSAAPSPAAARGFAAPATASSGARNESSVLFSLSALTSGSSSSRPSVPAPSAPNNDDSGLIDLKALTEAATAQARPMPHVSGAVAPAQFAPPVVAPMLAPLGVPGTRGASVPPPKKGNTGLYIIGASIVVAVAAAAAVVTLINKEPPPPPVLTQAAPPPPAPAPAPAALPEQPDTPALPAADEPKLPADAPSSTSKTTTAKKAPTKTSSSTSSASKPSASSSSSTSSSSSSSSSTSSKPAASKPASKCNCKSGDLMCAMRCSSK